MNTLDAIFYAFQAVNKSSSPDKEPIIKLLVFLWDAEFDPKSKPLNHFTVTNYCKACIEVFKLLDNDYFSWKFVGDHQQILAKHIITNTTFKPEVFFITADKGSFLSTFMIKTNADTTFLSEHNSLLNA